MYVYYDYNVRILTTRSCAVRILLAYTFRRTYYPSRTHFPGVCVLLYRCVRTIRNVRIFLAYAFYRRTHIVTTYFNDARTYPTDVRVRSTYVLLRRTCATDVRIYRRTPFRGVRTLEIEDSGLRSRDQNSGLRRTLRI